MNIEIRNQEPLRVVAMRHKGPYHQIGAAFGRLNSWMKETGLVDKLKGFTPVQKGVALYYDNPRNTPEADLNSDACSVIPADLEITDDRVHIVTVPGGAYGVALFIGPYSGIGAAWEHMMTQWLPSCGRDYDPKRFTGEFYLNMCGDVPDSELRTEIFVPII